MIRKTYKGFELAAVPKQLSESAQWTLEVVITKHHDSRNETLTAPYSAANTFASKEEAENASLEFGAKIIDGSIPGLSVSSLL